MRRFTRNNGITEGFHTRMEALQRQAYGFRNFGNYRLLVTIMCSGIDRRRGCPINGVEPLVAGDCNVPNALSVPFRIELYG